MISFIVPATNKDKIINLALSLERLPIDYELIDVYGATSFFDAWRKGLEHSRGEYVILTHQDTEYHYIPDLKEIFKELDIGLCGVAGCKDYDIKDPWWFSRKRLIDNNLSGQIYHDSPESKGLSIFGDYDLVDVLDGVCLVTKRLMLKEILRRIKVNVTWDWYDHVLSCEYIKDGWYLRTIPILMTHGSAGGERRSTFEKERKEFIKWYEQNKD